MVRYAVTVSVCVLVALAALRAGEAARPVPVPVPVELSQDRDANATQPAGRSVRPAKERRPPARSAGRRADSRVARSVRRANTPRREAQDDRTPVTAAGGGPPAPRLVRRRPAVPRAPARSTPVTVVERLEPVRAAPPAAPPAPVSPVAAERDDVGADAGGAEAEGTSDDGAVPGDGRAAED